MIEAVGELLRTAAAEIVLPRYRALQSSDIKQKDGADVVTVVDHEVEAFLTRQLMDLLPGSKVVAEEATASQPARYDLLSEDATVWLIDPLDGTANFVAGVPCVSLMVALIERGRTVASWMLNPLSDILAVCERGGGAFLGKNRIFASSQHIAGTPLRGAILKRFLPVDVRSDIESREGGIGTVLPGLMCAGHEYPAIATGDEDFALFWRTEPWDHAPGVLFLEEAGGYAARFDGSEYNPADRRTGLLAARSQEIWYAVQRTLGLQSHSV